MNRADQQGGKPNKQGKLKPMHVSIQAPAQPLAKSGSMLGFDPRNKKPPAPPPPLATSPKAGTVKPPPTMSHKSGSSSSALLSAKNPASPTLKEMGFDIPAIYNWMGFFAPAGTPAATINLLNKEITAALTEPATAKWLADTGFETVASSPAELDRFVVSEIDRWRGFVREFNVRFD